MLQDFDSYKFREIKGNLNNKSLEKELLHMENRFLIKNYKFGIIYAKEGQTDERDMFSNEHGSKHFDKFLGMLGTRLTLKGWTGYKGELDCEKNSTGTQSIFTQFEGFDIMFHVSTLLPFSETNNQQIERKRHIGNDIVVIIFMEGSKTSFHPSTISSKYNHVYIVVQHTAIPSRKNQNKLKDRYKIGVVSKEGVLPFAPLLPENATFLPGEDLRKFLLSKCVNAERAAYSAPSFSVQRTRRDWLKDIVSKAEKLK